MTPLKQRLTPHQQYKRMAKRHRREAERAVHGPKPGAPLRGFMDFLLALTSPAVRHSRAEGTRPAEQ